jgi:hypothetical protein
MNQPVPRTILDPAAETERAARLVRQALTQLGHAHTTQDGRLVQVCYKSLSVAGDQYGLLEVDTQRLPPRVNVAKLVHEDVLHHLTAVVGKPVRRLNTTGLTYCVELRPTPKIHLPQRVDLDLSHRPAGKPYQVPIGVGHAGPIWRSLLDTGHILVGGESGGGKSTWLHSLLAALLTAHDPAELQLYLVDPKMVEFTVWAGVPHLALPIAEEAEAATQVTEHVLAEMERRVALFQSVLARDLATYNVRRTSPGNVRRTLPDNQRASEPLPLVLVIIDEVTDLALQAGLSSPFYTNLIRLASKARSFGVVLVLATQHPKAEVLNTLIRENISTRIAFRVTTAEHSRVILGEGGAQELPRTVRGRLAARLDGDLTTLQGYYLSDEALRTVAGQVGQQSAPSPLAGVEQDLVAYAVAHLDGAFRIDDLAQAFAGRVSRHRLKQIGQRWEQRGWLTPAQPGQHARQVTAELLTLAGLTEDAGSASPA